MTTSRLHSWPTLTNREIMTFLVVIFGAFFVNIPAQAAELCKEGKKQLRGDYEVLQGTGGMWGFMEKAAILKDKSVVGLQVDGKLQRAVVAFESMCEAESTKKPDEATYKKILNEISRAMAINNKTPGRTPVEELLTSIEALNKDLDGLLQGL